MQAQLYVKDDGGNYTAYAEKNFTLYPGTQKETLSYPQAAPSGGGFRIELRILENNFSREVFAQRVELSHGIADVNAK